MSSTPENLDTLIRMLVRSINKRIDYTSVPAEDDASRITVSLSLQNRTATVNIRLDDLVAAEQDLMRRNQIRTALKRSLDRAMFEPVRIASTAMLRPDSQAEGFFRSSFGGRRRR